MQPDDILEGAILALDQSARLLSDSFALFERGSCASAVVLGIFAREEMGRCQMLLDLREQVIAGASVASDEIGERYQDHVAKLKHSQSGTYARLSPEQTTAFIASWRNPQGAQYEAFRDALDHKHKRGRQQGAQDLHDQRVTALYIDVDDHGRWSRPYKIAASEVYRARAQIAVFVRGSRSFWYDFVYDNPT